MLPFGWTLVPQPWQTLFQFSYWSINLLSCFFSHKGKTSVPSVDISYNLAYCALRNALLGCTLSDTSESHTWCSWGKSTPAIERCTPRVSHLPLVLQSEDTSQVLSKSQDHSRYSTRKSSLGVSLCSKGQICKLDFRDLFSFRPLWMSLCIRRRKTLLPTRVWLEYNR